MYYKRTIKGLALFLFFGMALIAFHACKKQKDQSESASLLNQVDRFFNVDGNIDPLVSYIESNIKRQDQQRHLVNKLITKAGFPLWDKARVVIKEGETKKIVYIPFVMDKQKQTKAILLVKVSDQDTLFHLLYGAQYRDYSSDSQTAHTWNAKDVFHAFMLFDYEIFNVSKFQVFDKLLIGDTTDTQTRNVSLSNVSYSISGRENSAYPVTTWSTIIVCHSCGNDRASSMPCCNAEYYDVSVVYWFDDSDDTWGWYTPSGYGGGGGADVAPCPGCSWEDTNPCALDAYGHAINFCDEEWQPVVTENTYNPLTYDSITIDHGILDSNFNCLYNLLKNDMEKINQKSQLVLSSVFGVNLYNHLHFKMNWNGTADSPYIMRTTYPGRVQTLNNQLNFFDTVQINAYYARHMSKEMAIAAIVHESIHAYINWCIKCYQNNNAHGIDSTYLKDHFSIYWEYIVNRPYSTQHDVLVNKYIDEIVEAVVAGGNQNAPEPLRRYIGKALAYSGLHDTSAWQNLSSNDKCNYEGVQDWSQHYDEPPGWQFNISGCRSYNTAFKDSLQLSGLCH